MSPIRIYKVLDENRRQQALKIVERVYLNEKKWISSLDEQIPRDLGRDDRQSWFLAKIGSKPAGLLRLFYDPNLSLPKEFKVTLNFGIDFENMKKNSKFVDIGRFMILPEYRFNILVAIRLMKAAIKEVVERDYSHFITDVYEGEVNSPLSFHTKILGFEIIGKHLYGELNCSCSRIILALDILKAYKKMRNRKEMIYRSLTYGIRGLLNKKIASLKNSGLV